MATLRLVRSMRPAAGFCLSGILFLSLAGAPAARTLRADDSLLLDTVLLANGGEIRGKVSEIEENRQRFYLVQVGDGIVYKFKRSQVRQVVRPPEAMAEYLERLNKLADTVEAHWEMQEWCVHNNLPRQREYHLQQVIRLDPDHEGARERLGYRFDAGTWIHEDHFYQNHGYIKDERGRWRLPVGIHLSKEQEAVEDQIKHWTVEVRSLINRYKRRQDLSALNQIAAITDPAAVQGLYEATEKADGATLKVLIDALGNIPSAQAQQKLVQLAMKTAGNDALRDIREQCVRLLKQPHFSQPGVVQSLLPFLSPKPDTPNVNVQVAAWIVGQMGEPTAIPALINALNTTHRIQISTGGGNIQAGQGTGGRGLSMGDNKPKYVMKEFQNQTALDALRLLTSSRDYGYNEQAWMQWYIGTRDLGIASVNRDE